MLLGAYAELCASLGAEHPRARGLATRLAHLFATQERPEEARLWHERAADG